MSIQRVPEAPFAQIANSALRDRRLSFKARGILALVLSNVGEWEAGRDWIVEQSDKDGKHAVQEALNELTTLGYRSVAHEQTKAGIRTVVVWKHVPDDLIFRPPGSLTVGNPDRRDNGRAIEHHPSEHHLQEHHQEISTAADDSPTLELIAPVVEINRRFEDFYRVYPRKVGRKAAERAWAKAISEVPAEHIITAAAAFRDDPNREDQFTPHPATWLNQGRWDDEALPPRDNGRKSAARLYADAVEAMPDPSWTPLEIEQ